jgi:pyrroloquinoline-quinone synthase
MNDVVNDVMSPDALEGRLRAIGDARYHNRHPFHQMLHGGRLNFGQVQAWALNRYVYQAAIPRKDAALMARLDDRALRREWVHRIHDHDGVGEDEGGIERWLKLTDGLRLDRTYVMSQAGALPATKFAVEAYVRFVYEHPTLAAVASSLTELFAPAIHAERIAGMLEHYDFIGEALVAYFRRRLNQAPRDAGFALDYVRANARTREAQAAVLRALTFKTEVLWAQLDALHFAYVDPGFVPAGAFRPAVQASAYSTSAV